MLAEQVVYVQGLGVVADIFAISMFIIIGLLIAILRKIK
jgi:hypothetical protein